MMRDVAQVLKRADDMFGRLARTPEGRAAIMRRARRHTQFVFRRIMHATLAVVGVTLATLLYGLFVAPIGIEGLLLMALAALGIGGYILFRRPGTAAPTAQTGRNADLAALARRVEDWLDRQRRNLPARTAGQTDEILLRLEVLGEQLAQLSAGAPLAGDARRLIGDHLPRLVDAYLKVPRAYRGAGSEPERQLADGLVTIADELRWLSEQLARGDLDALAVEGRFLEQRYRDNTNP